MNSALMAAIPVAKAAVSTPFSSAVSLSSRARTVGFPERE